MRIRQITDSETLSFCSQFREVTLFLQLFLSQNFVRLSAYTR